jgi:ABC-type sugar transport systems, permease components
MTGLSLGDERAAGAARTGRRRALGRSGAEIHRRWWTPLLWTAPTVAATLVFAVVPFVNTIYLSLTDAKPLGGQVDFVGIQNYITMLTSSSFWTSVFNSVLYAALSVPLLVVLPLVLAGLVIQRIPFMGLFRSAFYVPAVASTVVAGLAWQFLFSDSGPINTILGALHVAQHGLPFLSDRWMLLFTAIALTVWKGLGFYMVLYIAALANVDRSLYEAAETDGASALRRLWHITLPGVRPMIYLVGVLSAIGSLRIFTEIYMLGGQTGGIGGQNETLPFYIRDVGLVSGGNLGLGSAASVALFVMTLGFIIASQRLRVKAEADQ